MPLIQVTAKQDALTNSERDDLMSRVSNAVLKSEGAPIEDAGAQSLVWAYYNELPASSIYVGGEALQDPPLRIDVTTPAGALNDTARTTLVADIGTIVDEIVGQFDGRLNQWTMLYELDEGSWSGSGQIFRLADIQAAMSIPATQH